MTKASATALANSFVRSEERSTVLSVGDFLVLTLCAERSGVCVQTVCFRMRSERERGVDQSWIEPQGTPETQPETKAKDAINVQHFIERKVYFFL